MSRWKKVSYDDTLEGGENTFDTPTSEELAAGKKPYVVNRSKDDYASLENGKIAAYALYASFDKSQAVKVEITLPFEIAKILNIYQLTLEWFGKQAKKVEFKDMEQVHKT